VLPPNGSHRIEELAFLIQGRLALKRYEWETNWAERWRAWLQFGMKRVFKWMAIAVGTWLLVFHTPMVWRAASYLKVVDAPRPADAIVVLAGGVGESGQAGQGYEERVARAVELYQKGFAPRMIFVSGYTYRFEETQVMRVLALSLGVPARDILLESRGSNTYAQAREVTALLREIRGRSALLVSAPYHMRRALLTFRRQGPDIQWIPTPIIESGFYGREGRVALRHIRALLHELFAIFYYRMQGWL